MITKFKKYRKGSEQLTLGFLSGLLALLVIVGFLVVSNVRINQKRQVLNSQFRELKEEAHVLEQRNQELKAQITQIAEEGYWEEKIREQGYQKPGETVVVIKTEEEKSELIEESKGFWQKFLEIFRL